LFIFESDSANAPKLAIIVRQDNDYWVSRNRIIRL